MTDQQTFQQRLGSRIGLQSIKDLRITVMARSVILTGKAKSYYYKQIVNTIALEVFPKHVISNNIEVLN